MLLHQGAAAFRLWTGQEAPLEVMQTALAEARATGASAPPRASPRPRPASAGDARRGAGTA